MRLSVLVLASAACALLTSTAASAIEPPPASINEPPKGAGTEQPKPAKPGERVRPGVEASANLGLGFSDTYGFGVGARVGYTWAAGLYGGGAIDYYVGRTTDNETAHALFVGGEAGYKFFPTADAHWEIRPYVLAGVGNVRQVDPGPRINEVTRFAVQPGLLGAYHFGPAFISAEARLHATPTPAAFALFAGAGLGF